MSTSLSAPGEKWIQDFEQLSNKEKSTCLLCLKSRYPSLFKALSLPEQHEKKFPDDVAFLEADKGLDIITLVRHDLASSIFNFLGARSLLRCMQVSKYWNEILRSDFLNPVWYREFSSWFPSSRHILPTDGWLKVWQRQLSLRRRWLSLTKPDGDEQHRVNRWEFLGHSDRVRHVKVRGSKFISASWDGTVRLGDVHNLTSETEQIVQHRKSIFGVWFDGSMVASCSEDFTIHIYSVKDMKHLAILNGHQRSVYRIEVVRDLLISCSSDFIGVWNWKKGLLLKKLMGHTAGFDVHRLQVCKNKIVTGSYDGRINIWKFNNETKDSSNTCVKSIWKSPRLHRGGVSALHVSGNLVGSGSAYGDIFIFDIKKGDFILQASNNIKIAKGSRNESRIVTCVQIIESLELFVCSSIISFYSGNGHLCIWSIPDNSCTHVIKQNSYINSLKFEYGLLFSAESDGSVRIRDVLDKDFKLVAQEKLSKGQLFDVDVQEEAMVSCGLDRVFLVRPLGK